MPTRVPWVCLVTILAAILNFHKTAKIGENRDRGNLFDHNFSYIDIFSTNEVSKFEIFNFTNFKTGHVLIGQL